MMDYKIKTTQKKRIMLMKISKKILNIIKMLLRKAISRRSVRLQISIILDIIMQKRLNGIKKLRNKGIKERSAV